MLTGIHPVKAIATVDRLITTRHKRDFGGDAATVANRIIHGPIRIALAAAVVILIAVTICTVVIA